VVVRHRGTAERPRHPPRGRRTPRAARQHRGDDQRRTGVRHRRPRRHAGLLYGVDPFRWELLRTDVIEHALPVHPAGQPLQQRVVVGDGLYVAGDHRDTPSIQGALVSGRRAADAVLASVGAAVA